MKWSSSTHNPPRVSHVPQRKVQVSPWPPRTPGLCHRLSDSSLLSPSQLLPSHTSPHRSCNVPQGLCTGLSPAWDALIADTPPSLPPLIFFQTSFLSMPFPDLPVHPRGPFLLLGRLIPLLGLCFYFLVQPALSSHYRISVFNFLITCLLLPRGQLRGSEVRLPLLHRLPRAWHHAWDTVGAQAFVE